MASKPLQRSLDLLRQSGYTADVAERYNSFCRRRFDLWGFADIVAFGAGWPGVLAVQACRGSTSGGGDVATHITKIMATPGLAEFLECGNRFEIFAWSQRQKNGRQIWVPRIVRFEVHAEPRRLACFDQGERMTACQSKESLIQASGGKFSEQEF